MSLRIVDDGSIGQVERAPRVVLPDPGTCFSERAARLAQRASNHLMAEFLQTMALLARAQHAVLQARAAEPVAAALLAASRQYGMPPLAALSHARGADWRADLRALCQVMSAHAVNGTAAVLAQLQACDDGALEALADRILTGNTLDADAERVPFVGAALQVYFTRLAAALPVADLGASDVPTVCPVCATRPLASVVRIGPGRESLRYLHCALCATEWNMARVKCSACEEDKSVKYLSIEEAGRDGTVAVARAETCDECKSYLKIFNQEKDPLVEPTADDLATLALDLLVDAQGYARSGPNLLLHPGSG